MGFITGNYRQIMEIHPIQRLGGLKSSLRNAPLLCRTTLVSHGRPLPRSQTACPRSCQCQVAQSSPDDGSSNASSADDILQDLRL